MNTDPTSREEKTIKIGDYLVKQTIGSGTFSKVKLGINRITNQKVAIKLLDKSKIIEKDDLERIIREMKIYREISHPNVIKVYEMLDTNKFYMIIMEYYERGELFNYIVEHEKLTEEETAFFFYQLINGIEYIHNKGIAHRDLKPENLLLDKDKKLKIIDFGLSNFFDGKKYLSTPCGSPCYASPEMVAGNNYDGFKIDIWAIGIILYACFCGYLPFEDDDNDILFKKILQCKLDYPKHLSRLSKDIMNKILVTDPERRITIEQIKKHNFYLLGQKIYNDKFNLNIDDFDFGRKSYTANHTFESNIANKNYNEVDYNELMKEEYNPNKNKVIISSRNKNNLNLYNEYNNIGNSINTHIKNNNKINISKKKKNDENINYTINEEIKNKKNNIIFNNFNRPKGNSIQEEYKAELTEFSRRNYNIKIKNNNNNNNSNQNDILNFYKIQVKNMDRNKIILKPVNQNNIKFNPNIERKKYVSNPKKSNHININLNELHLNHYPPHINRRNIVSEIKYNEDNNLLPMIRNEHKYNFISNRTPLKTDVISNEPLINFNKIKTNRMKEFLNLNFNRNPIYFNSYRGNTSN